MNDVRCPNCHSPITLTTTRCPNCGISLDRKLRRPVRRVELGTHAATIGLSDLFQMALQGIRANKVRAMFPIVGVVFGIGTVILLMAIGRGVKLDITRQFAELGPRVITVRSGNRGEDIINGKQRKELPPPVPPRLLHTSSLELEDVEAVQARDNSGLIQAGTGVTNVTSPMKQKVYAGDTTSGDFIKAPLIGTDEHYPAVRGLRLVAGRFIRNTAEDEDRCVVGQSILKSLFNGITPATAVSSAHRLTVVDPGVRGPQQPGKASSPAQSSASWSHADRQSSAIQIARCTSRYVHFTNCTEFRPTKSTSSSS